MSSDGRSFGCKRHVARRSQRTECKFAVTCGRKPPHIRLDGPERRAACLPTQTERSVPMNFGEAIAALKSGKKVSRAGWNGKGMFLIYVPGTKDAKLNEGTPYEKALNS